MTIINIITTVFIIIMTVIIIITTAFIIIMTIIIIITAVFIAWRPFYHQASVCGLSISLFTLILSLIIFSSFRSLQCTRWLIPSYFHLCCRRLDKFLRKNFIKWSPPPLFLMKSGFLIFWDFFLFFVTFFPDAWTNSDLFLIFLDFRKSDELSENLCSAKKYH